MCAMTGEAKDTRNRGALWALRIAFAIVFIINVQCALSFVIWPASYAAAYELEGVAGNAAVQGIGIAFLMWNATYPAFIAQPQRFSVLGWVIIAQQIIGLIGETGLFISLPAGHEVLASSVMRFIVFDAAGLVVMFITWAIWLAARRRASV